jgi:PilZ domain
VAPKREKRTVRRIEPLATPCRVRHGSRQIAGHLVDLSPRGARIASEEPLPRVGSRVVVEARFRGMPATRLPGQVRWIKPSPGPAEGETCGISFRGITGEQQLALEFVIYEFKRRAAQLG